MAGCVEEDETRRSRGTDDVGNDASPALPSSYYFFYMTHFFVKCFDDDDDCIHHQKLMCMGACEKTN